MNNKIALITGSAKGLGKAFSVALLDRGAKVCICDIDVQDGKTTAVELGQKYGLARVTFTPCDVTSQDDMEGAIKHTVDHFGGLDIFCNNAGIGHNEDEWRKTMDINLTGVIRGTLLSLQCMDKTKGGTGGVIINVASVSGLLPTKYNFSYVASKFGVVGLSRALGELTPTSSGVRVNCICPTFTQTDIIKRTGFKVAAHEKSQNQMYTNIGFMQPEEVAEAFIRLVEDETLSGAVMLVTPDRKEVLRLPLSVPEMFAACKM